MYINGKKVIIKVVPNVGIRIVSAEVAVEPSDKRKRFSVISKDLFWCAFFPAPVVISAKLLMELLQIAINARG